MRIGNQVETESRTLEVRIEVDNARWAPESRHVRRRGNHHDDAARCLVIPDSALQTDEDKQIVFVALDAKQV